MSDNFETRDELTERLSALGQYPVSPALQSEHLTALAGVARGASWRSMLASRVKLGAAVLGGFLIGTTGLASAGALGPLQPIAKTTVEAVVPFVEVPEGKGGNSEAAKAKAAAKKAAKGAKGAGGEPKAGKNWAGCLTEPSTISHRNRGQYLKSVRAAEAAGSLPVGSFKTAQQSPCGKSLNPDGTVAEDPAKDETKKPEGGKAEEQGKSAEKRQDADDDADGDKSEGRRGGKSGVEPKPGDTPVVPAPADPAPENQPEGTPATPETPNDAAGANPSSAADNSGS